MARYIDAKCRLCRREGMKLFLKGSRCYSPKCPIARKGAVPPGQHGYKRSRNLSEYGTQLREKQKVKRLYGVQERQFKNYFEKALSVTGNTGEKFLQLLERRLDNVVFRGGLASSRAAARQLITHGFCLINNKKVTIPSYQTRKDDVITLNEKGLKLDSVLKNSKSEVNLPAWLKRKAVVLKVDRLPTRDDVVEDINETLIIEFYSR